MSTENVLTPTNYIEKIKTMAKRDQAKISAKRLIELFRQIPDQEVPAAINEIQSSIDHINRILVNNRFSHEKRFPQNWSGTL